MALVVGVRGIVFAVYFSWNSLLENSLSQEQDGDAGKI